MATSRRMKTDRAMMVPRAVLLLGATGSGKSPLGGWLEQHGLWGSRAHHFDFGASLRAVVQAGPSPRFQPRDIEFLRGVLERGLLLENDSFPLAAQILHLFLEQRQVGAQDWLILNGLPRHLGQARDLEPHLHVRAVIELLCDAATIRERLRLNTGGDRTGRDDDTPALVASKLAAYEARTRPLTEYYRSREIPILGASVGVATRPEAVVAALGPSLLG